MQTVGERMREVRKAIKPKQNQSEFGETLGIGRDTIANYEGGRVEPPLSVIKLICLTFGVSRRWLETGEGEMFLPPQETEDISAELRRVLRGKGETAQSALLALASLPDSWFDTLADALEKTKQTKK